MFIRAATNEPCTEAGCWMDAPQVRTHVGEVRTGRLRVALWVDAAALLVEREFAGRDGVNRLSVRSFQHRVDFTRWWSTDPIRFVHPVLHAAVQREATDFPDVPPGHCHELLAG